MSGEMGERVKGWRWEVGGGRGWGELGVDCLLMMDVEDDEFRALCNRPLGIH